LTRTKKNLRELFLNYSKLACSLELVYGYIGYIALLQIITQLIVHSIDVNTLSWIFYFFNKNVFLSFFYFLILQSLQNSDKKSSWKQSFSL